MKSLLYGTLILLACGCMLLGPFGFAFLCLFYLASKK